jgi:hypothetical protein
MVRSETEQNNDSFHNQWQVGKFLPQKQLKVGERYFQFCTRAKAAMTFEPFDWFLTFKKQKQVQKRKKRT